jgi:uncharacterized protein DUF5047
MWPTSAGYKVAVAAEHQAAWRLETLLEGTVTGTYDRAITAGGVSVSKQAPIRRSLRLTAVDLDGTLAARLDVYGHEVRIYRGIVVSGAAELVPLGTFGITDARNPDSDGVVWEVQGYDRGGVINERRFYEVYTVAAGTNYGTAIQDLVRSKFPAMTFNPVAFSALTTSTTPALFFEVQAAPWQVATGMARSIGMELVMDPMGVCVLQPEPVPLAANIVRTYSDPATGVAGFPLLRLDVSRSRRGTYNGVVVTGESTSLAAPIRGSAWDSNPASRTYRYGAFGEVPLFAFNPLMSAAAQCDAAAAAELQAQLGSTQQVEYQLIPDAAHDASDVVRFVKGTVDDVYVLDTFEVPLAVEEPISGSCRTRQAAS